MGWWFGYAAARALGDVIREAGASSPRSEDYLLPDEQARQHLCARIAAEPGLDGSHVVVSVLSGELSLTGSVRTEAAEARVRELANATPGVKHVRSELEVGAR